MPILIPESELQSHQIIPCICESCNRKFDISRSLARRHYKGTKNVRYCSKHCFTTGQRITIKGNCKYCNAEIERVPSAIEASGNVFCNHSCSAKYHNPSKQIKSYLKNPRPVKNCVGCNIPLLGRGKFCSLTCQCQYKKKKTITDWLNGTTSSCSGQALMVKKSVRTYLKDQSNNKCSKCNWAEIHPVTKTCPLEINHIDGDPSNGHISNLEVLCPNCHALTPNFRNLNSNSPRKRKVNKIEPMV